MRRVSFLLAAMLAGCAVAQAAPPDPSPNPFERLLRQTPGGNQPASPQRYGGNSCDAVLRQVPASAVWWGRFAGGRFEDFAGRGTSTNSYTAEGCFPNRAACERWMYDLKSAYGDAPVYNQCRAGYQPGAALPLWSEPGGT